MAQLQNVFDATQIDPSQGVGQLPVGAKLPVAIVDSEVKATKDNQNGYIQFTLQVQSGEHAGRKGAYRLHMYHQKEDTRRIAATQLSALCHVTGVFQVQDTQQLHNIPFLVDVVAQADPKYTEVKAVYDINGNEPGRAHHQASNQPNGGNNPSNAGGWGGQTQQQQQPAQEQQQTQQQPAVGGWSGQQTQPEQQQQQGGAPAWGGGQQQQQAPAQNAGGWQQGGNNGGSAPWGR